MKNKANVKNLFDRAAAEFQAGRFAQAQVICQKIIAKDSKDADAFHLLGLIEMNKGNIQQAISWFEKSAAVSPDNPVILHSIGNAYAGHGDFASAEKYYGKVLTIHPGHAESLLALANISSRQGKLTEALTLCQKALDLNPGLVNARKIIGDIYYKQGDLKRAIETYRGVLETAPGHPDCLFNLGLVYRAAGDIRRSVQCFENILAQRPDHAASLYNIGLSLKLLRDSYKAIEYLEKVIDRIPEALPPLYFELMKICDWRKLSKLTAALDSLTEKQLSQGRVTETPFVNVCRIENPQLNLQVARCWAKEIAGSVAGSHVRFDFNGRKQSGKRIRIGYLSNDFYDHATAHLTFGLYGGHDRQDFEVYAYSYSNHTLDAYTDKIAADCEKFTDITHDSFAAAARRIYEDQIDILIDLKGYTTDARLEIAALRPAPVQVTYLGFPGTSGAEFFDYVIADRIVIPEQDKKFFTEKVVYVQDCYQVTNKNQPIAARSYSRQELDLPEQATVFCCFNQAYKIDDRIFNCWMNILKAVPDSVLWLYADNPVAIKNLKQQATFHGVAEERIIFAAKVSKDRHLARMKMADIALDTLVYNGHTTTSDALWAGVPVVTVQGRHFASRVASSILTACGLTELITDSLDEYENLVVSLAGNPPQLAELRKRLAENIRHQPLFDTGKFVHSFDCALRNMWKIYCQGDPPRHIDVRDEPCN